MILAANPQPEYPEMYNEPVGPEATDGYFVDTGADVADERPKVLRQRFYPAGVGLPPVLVGQMMKGRAAIDARLSLDQ